MSTLREAAQQALEALEALDAPPSGVVDHYELDRRKQALRAALAQQEQAEPVLVVEKEPDYMSRGHFYEGSKPFIDPTLVWKLPIGTKLYTAPPRCTGLPHCERSCEANAFQIEIRRLTGEVRMLQEQNTELDRKLAALEQPEQEQADAEAALRFALAQRDWAFKQLQAQPDRREWRSLSEEEIYPLYSEPRSDAEMVEFARAIEARLKEKNHD